jgi:hypothetical protein
MQARLGYSAWGNLDWVGLTCGRARVPYMLSLLSCAVCVLPRVYSVGNARAWPVVVLSIAFRLLYPFTLVYTRRISPLLTA